MPFAMTKSDARLRADLHKPERLENEHVSLCTYTMDMKDMNRWQVFLPCMNVHTHLQAAALRIYPHKKLLLPKGSVVCETDPRRGGKGSSLNTKYVRGICKKDTPECFKFDVAQVWNLHSPSSYVTPYGFGAHLLVGLRYGRIGGQYVRYGRMGERRVRVRGVYRFSSLVKQNKKGKNCFVIYIAGKKKLLFYNYAVIVKQKIYKRSSNYYSKNARFLQFPSSKA